MAKIKAPTDKEKIQRIKNSVLSTVNKYWKTWQKPISQSSLMRPFYPSLSRLGSNAAVVLNEMEDKKSISVQLSPRSGSRYVFPTEAVKALGEDGVLQAVMMESW